MYILINNSTIIKKPFVRNANFKNILNFILEQYHKESALKNVLQRSLNVLNVRSFNISSTFNSACSTLSCKMIFLIV